MASPEDLLERIGNAFDDLHGEVVHGEVTLHAEPHRLLDLLVWLRDDEIVDAELLTDVSGVHWPAGEKVIERQPTTTGWPEYRVSRDEGVIEVLYMVRSLRHGHFVRIAVRTDDTDARVPSTTAIWPQAALFHEREVYDMFGVVFEGHPDLRRILMPDDWIGHPHRKDYPLGGVEIPYENDKFIPPPDERSMRDVIEGDYK